ncbi:hypothetical protein L912_3114 [Escherichia coli SCD1]|nr:hypothetical protein L912_3114 [Escherichia coli SCD1]
MPFEKRHGLNFILHPSPENNIIRENCLTCDKPNSRNYW